jgi:hypothetical protein
MRWHRKTAEKTLLDPSTGTVTFLFTDIEGPQEGMAAESSRFWDALFSLQGTLGRGWGIITR